MITVHDLAFLHFPEILDADARRYYSQVRAAVHDAEAVITVSQATRADIAHLLGLQPERIDVVYEAADPRFAPLAVARGEQRVINGCRVEAGGFLLFVSTVEPRKNLATLLRALRLCLDRRPGAEYRLIVAGGRGWLDEPIYDLVGELRLREAVHFLGAVSLDDLPWLYSACRLYVNPSLYEGFGLPALEALACGAASLVADTSSLPEVVGDAARRIPPREVEAWAGAIADLWDDDAARAELSRRGPARAALFPGAARRGKRWRFTVASPRRASRFWRGRETLRLLERRVQSGDGQPGFDTLSRLHTLFGDDARQSGKRGQIIVEVGNPHPWRSRIPDLFSGPEGLGGRHVAWRQELLAATQGIHRHLAGAGGQGNGVGAHLVDQTVGIEVIGADQHHLHLRDHGHRQGVNHQGDLNAGSRQFAGQGAPFTARAPLGADHPEAPASALRMAQGRPHRGAPAIGKNLAIFGNQAQGRLGDCRFVDAQPALEIAGRIGHLAARLIGGGGALQAPEHPVD